MCQPHALIKRIEGNHVPAVSEERPNEATLLRPDHDALISHRSDWLWCSGPQHGQATPLIVGGGHVKSVAATQTAPNQGADGAEEQ